MKTKLLAMMLVAGGSMFAQTRFSFGIGFAGQGLGFAQAPPSYASNIPPSPGPDFVWVDGFWSQSYGQENWVPGYWMRQPAFTFYQSAPRFENRFVDRDDRFGGVRFGDDRFSDRRNFERDDNRRSEQNRTFSDRAQTRNFGQSSVQSQDRGQQNFRGQANRGDRSSSFRNR